MNITDTPSTRNITRLFRTATTEQIVAGAAWYEDAYAVASALAVKNGVTVEIAAGVIAAVSPLNSWGANVNLAARILAAGGLSSGYLTLGLNKATAILKGADILKTLNGEKISNFYLSIVSQGRKGVCIDRHSWSLSVNVRYAEGNIPNIKGKRYAAAVAAHVQAAKILSREYGFEITPAQVQSVTWKLWRAKFWAEGAYDSFEDVL